MMLPPIRHIAPETRLAEDHLALDEALLLDADAGRTAETLRIWEFERPVVVVGRSSRLEHEVQLSFCQQASIAVLRRCSGGAAIVGGPGCLMYSLVLNLDRVPQLRKIDVAHQFVIGRVLAAVQRQLPAARFQGICDLTWQDRKFSGNSLRIARSHLLYHGTLLYGADLSLIDNCLADAPRQPEYRGGRDHRDFVINVPIDPCRLRTDLADQFGCRDDPDYQPSESRIRSLRHERYDDPAWHRRH
jgi:lipoate-protein ligase A